MEATCSSHSVAGMDTLRTAHERFEGLSGYPFAPHYADVGDAEGERSASTTSTRARPAARRSLLMHGEPSWSYLYRT